MKRVQPGTGDNLTRDDIANGYTDYVIWNRFKPERLDIDGELDMECVDSGMATGRFGAGVWGADCRCSVAIKRLILLPAQHGISVIQVGIVCKIVTKEFRELLGFHFF